MRFDTITTSDSVYQRLITYSKNNIHLQIKFTLLGIYFTNSKVQTIIFTIIIFRYVLYNLWTNMNYRYKLYMTNPSIYVPLNSQWSAKCELY